MDYNSPLLVTASGTSILAFGILSKNIMPAVVLGGWTLQLVTIGSFVVNAVSVSIPGRLDGIEDEKMRSRLTTAKGNESSISSSSSSSSTTTTTTTTTTTNTNLQETAFSVEKGRSFVTPSGWAFAIWGPIYAGEAFYCFIGQFLMESSKIQQNVVVPFVCANLLQSLWCASFRPSYFHNSDDNIRNNKDSSSLPWYCHWTKFVSVGMLGGTAYSLSVLHNEIMQQRLSGTISSLELLYYLPMIIHFGWTTAATLVNFSGSMASTLTDSSKDVSISIAIGHGSALIATILGGYITLTRSSPAYGLTISWALAACASGMQKRYLLLEQQQQQLNDKNKRIVSAAKVERWLCQFGSVICSLASAKAVTNY